MTCPRCLVPMAIIALIAKPDIVGRILDHLHLPSTMPRIAPARLKKDDFYPDVCPDFAPRA